MNNDLMIIKKYYGEKMSHLCRTLFPTILEEKGLLPQLLFSHFHSSRFLYHDIVKQKKETAFQLFINEQLPQNYIQKKTMTKTPKELLNEVGYDLFECHSEEEIQSFRKYYQPGEELCTFAGGRLKNCYVFFAVKQDVDDIKREDFIHPERDDLYGTSVLSIQFTRNDAHCLSIKNRYNDIVKNPDATFSNNLDYIIPGLTESFADTYGMVQKSFHSAFDLEGYVIAEDGKFYKYNYEINNTYYCADNIIIDGNRKVIHYPKERYIIFDYFILDMKEKKIELFDSRIQDSLIYTIGIFDKVEIQNQQDGKILSFYQNNHEKIKIQLNETQNLIFYQNLLQTELDDWFLYYDLSLEEMNCPNVEKIGNKVLTNNRGCKSLSFPKLISVGNHFMSENHILKSFQALRLESVGDYFLQSNFKLESLSFPNLEYIGNRFLIYHYKFKELSFPSLREVGDNFMNSSYLVERVNMPHIVRIGNKFLAHNTELKDMYAPMLCNIGNNFLDQIKAMNEVSFPKLERVGNSFLEQLETTNMLDLPSLISMGNQCLKELKKPQIISFPELKKVGNYFLYGSKIISIDAPKLEIAGNNVLTFATQLQVLKTPLLTVVGDHFCKYSTSLMNTDFSSLHQVGDHFMDANTALCLLYCPHLEYVGSYFLSNNKRLEDVYIPELLFHGQHFLEQFLYDDSVSNIEEKSAYHTMYGYSIIDIEDKVHTEKKYIKTFSKQK